MAYSGKSESFINFQFFFQANALTYAVFASIIAYLAYNIPVMSYFTAKPDPVKSDALKYDRKTKSYVK